MHYGQASAATVGCDLRKRRSFRSIFRRLAFLSGASLCMCCQASSSSSSRLAGQVHSKSEPSHHLKTLLCSSYPMTNAAILVGGAGGDDYDDISDDDDEMFPDLPFGNNHARGQPFSRSISSSTRSMSQNSRHGSANRPKLSSPILYRYYGRSRVRGNADSIPFIFVGSNVDHFQMVAKLLAARGFSVFACERARSSSEEQGDKNRKTSQTSSRISAERTAGPTMVLEIMEALRWSRVVLVGFDKEASLAIESALQLAPDKVAGLVLAGDLVQANRLAKETGFPVLDSFLRRTLECPFVLIWDGESSLPPTSNVGGVPLGTDPSEEDRRLILGGGLAPHRKQPEQFAWILTRFVEENLGRSRKRFQLLSSRQQRASKQGGKGNLDRLLNALNLPFGIDALVSEEGRVVMGRAIATTIFYVTAVRILFIQYGILRAGIRTIKSRYDTVDSLRRRVFQSIGAFIVNFGYIPRLFRIRKATEDDDEDLKTSEPKTESDTSSKDAEGLDPEHESRVDESGDDSNDENDSNKRLRPLFFLDHVIT